MALIRLDLPSKDSMNRAMDLVGGLYAVQEPADPRELRAEVLARGIRALQVPPGADLGWANGLPLEFLIVPLAGSVEVVGTLQRLRGLHLGSWTGPLPFGALPSLEWFDTQEPERGQIDPLLELSSERLHHLSVGRYPFADTTPLRALQHLTHVALGDSRRLRSVDGLGHLRHLRHIVLYRCPGLESLAGLEAVPGLRHIEIENCSRITDLSPLADLTDLRSVKLELRTIPSLAPLIGHPGLEFVWLVSTKRPDAQVVEPLLQSPRLRFLAAGRSCWLRTEGAWKAIPNIYAATRGEAVLHEGFVDEYHHSAMW
jgi:hypothetical protein